MKPPAIDPKEVLEAATAASPRLAKWAEGYVRFMDDGVKVPGTKIGVGLDPVIGMLIPGAGDALTGVGSIALLMLALKQGVPTVIILKMVLNVLVDTLLGFIPVGGDIFDLFFRSNRRNLELIEKHKNGEKPRPRDYVIVAFGIFLAVLSVALPFIIVYGIGLTAVLGIWKLLSG